MIVAADTAGSAKTISDEKILDTAAIASSLAGKTYGLKVIDENFANSLNNITRFYVMSKNENLEFDKKKKTHVQVADNKALDIINSITIIKTARNLRAVFL